MRLKVVLPLLLAVAVLLAIIFLTSKNPPRAASVPQPVSATATVPAPITTPALVMGAPTNTVAPPAASRAEYIETRSDELMTLAMQDDTPSHLQVVNELRNPDPAIRKAAREALNQVNDRSIIPQMQEIADQTADPDEKQAIEDVIAFIQLPTIVEYSKSPDTEKTGQTNQP